MSKVEKIREGLKIPIKSIIEDLELDESQNNEERKRKIRTLEKNLISRFEDEGGFLSENYTERGIKKTIRPIIKDLSEGSISIQDFIENVAERLCDIQKFEVYIPLFNVKVEDEVLNYQNCTVEKFSKSRRKKLVKSIRKTGEKAKNISNVDKFAEPLIKKIDEFYVGNAVAVFELTRGRYEKTIEDARKSLMDIIDILSFFKSIIYPNKYRAEPSTEGSSYWGILPSFAIDVKTGKMSSKEWRTGALAPYSIEKMYKDLDPDLIEGIIECFNPSNEIEKRVKNSIRWFSKGNRADNDEDQLVSHVIGMEYLLGRGESDLAHNLGKRVAYILGSNKEQMLDIYSRIDELYDKRSNIVHGEGTDLSDEDIKNISQILRNCNIFLSDNKDDYVSFQNFRKKVESKTQFLREKDN